MSVVLECNLFLLILLVLGFRFMDMHFAKLNFTDGFFLECFDAVGRRMLLFNQSSIIFYLPT